MTAKLPRVRSSRRRRRRTHKLLAAGIVVLVLVALGGGSGVAYVALKSRANQLQANLTVELQAGQSDLEAGKASLQQANAKHDPNLALDAATRFGAAKVEFLAASQMADNSQLLQWLERTPGINDLAHSRHVAVDGIAAMGVAISSAGQDLAGLDGQLIKPPAGGQAGHTLLTVLSEAQATLTKVKQDFAAAKVAAAGVDASVLPAAQQVTFQKAKDTIDVALAGLDEFQRLVPVMTEVLGGNGPRKYLVEQVNPAELRPGGGFIGTYSVITADQGTLTVVRSGDAYDLANPRPLPGQPGFIPQPSPYREIIPDISWSFVDSNQYPDFPTNARIAETFAQPRIGKIDGVISIDYYTVASMLSLTGPFEVPGIGTLTADNFISTMIRLDISVNPIRKTALAALAGSLMQRVVAFQSGLWPNLIGALNSLATQRHLQAYFNDPKVEAEIDRVGWSGSMRSTGSDDFMMEVEANYWGNKANYFLTRSYSIALTRSGSTLHHVITVDLVNATPCGSEDRTAYRTNFRLFVRDTAGPVTANLRAPRYPNPAPPAGTQAADGWLPDVNCGGGRGQGVFAYDSAWAPSPRGFDQIYWQKQPGTVADTITVTWNYAERRTYRASGILDQDRIINLSATAVQLAQGKPAQAALPDLGLG